MPDERRQRLKELEAVIGSAFARAAELGRAFREIKGDNLQWEIDPALTFDQYCRVRWSYAARTAYQFLDAADIEDATRAIAQNMPINSESVGRELVPLLRQGGGPLVRDAWAKVAERYAGQRPPTAREVHDVLVEEGYREKAFSASSGAVSRRIRLGQYGDKLIAAEKRLDWFIAKELGDKPLAERDKRLAIDYAEKCERMARLLREIP